ncbi:hypothetical protein [uncultured Paracoccus sp.]|uniref:hypothetical protein n=1 Tax=uncultured Paracoccus sp. TaxID=189685 RepID=UPI002614CFB2|nr:hypothetical protein [uncultured Paracoccus sp.]
MLKTTASLTALLLAATLSATPAVAASEQAHDGHDEAAQMLSLDDGQKWQTDAPLRAAMETIRNAAAPMVADNGTSPAEYGALAAAVESQVDYMIANCELPPDADAQLHVLLGQVIEGAEQLTGDEPEAGMTLVAEALEAYDAHFAHEGWEPLTN